MPAGSGADAAIARVKVGMGDIAGDLDALEGAGKRHDPFFVLEPLTAPPFGNLRADPRLASLARTLGVQGG